MYQQVQVNSVLVQSKARVRVRAVTSQVVVKREVYSLGAACVPSFTIMEFITAKRGARAIVYEGHRYTLNRRGRDGRIFWMCGRSLSCSGSLSTLQDEIV